MNPIRRSTKRPVGSRGQGLAEFALILPAFLLLLLVAVDFGRLFYTYIQLTNTAREGAAYAALNPTTDNTTLTAIAVRESNVQAQRGETTVSATAACVDSSGVALPCSGALAGDGPGNRITVNVNEKFNFLTPLIGGFWPGGLTIQTSATAAVTAWAAGGSVPPPACSTKPPTPTFTWQSPDPQNHPFLISVNAGGSPNQASPCQNVGYNWDFGGASIDPGSDYLREGVTQDYEYAAAGTYPVKLSVSNAAGDSVVTTIVITLGGTTCNAPVASFTVSPAAIPNATNPTNWTYRKNQGHPGTTFTFDGNASAFMSDPSCHPHWSWSLGDGTTPAPTTATVVHVYPDLSGPTTVHVVLTVTSDGGTSSQTHDLPLVQDK